MVCLKSQPCFLKYKQGWYSIVLLPYPGLYTALLTPVDLWAFEVGELVCWLGESEPCLLP